MSPILKLSPILMWSYSLMSTPAACLDVRGVLKFHREPLPHVQMRTFIPSCIKLPRCISNNRKPMYGYASVHVLLCLQRMQLCILCLLALVPRLARFLFA